MSCDSLVLQGLMCEWGADVLKLVLSLSLSHTGHLQDDQCLAKEAEGKGDGLAKHVSRHKPYKTSVRHLQMEGGGAQGL